jgi:hypothetical protein
LVTVALNRELQGCELAEASQRGGVRFYAGALARFAPEHHGNPTPKQSVKPGRKSVKQSYTRLSGLTQAGIWSVWRIPAVSKTPPIHASVSFLADRLLCESAAGGPFAFLVSKANPS